MLQKLFHCSGSARRRRCRLTRVMERGSMYHLTCLCLKSMRLVALVLTEIVGRPRLPLSLQQLGPCAGVGSWLDSSRAQTPSELNHLDSEHWIQALLERRRQRCQALGQAMRHTSLQQSKVRSFPYAAHHEACPEQYGRSSAPHLSAAEQPPSLPRSAVQPPSDSPSPDDSSHGIISTHRPYSHEEPPSKPDP